MNGEITVRVDKSDLLRRLDANRATHRDTFEAAWAGYCEAMRKELEDKLTRIKDGKSIDPMLRHRAPEDHTDEYDEVIGMLKMALGDEIELTQAQYRQYVNDDWGWKQSWAKSTSEYLGGR